MVTINRTHVDSGNGYFVDFAGMVFPSGRTVSVNRYIDPCGCRSIFARDTTFELISLHEFASTCAEHTLTSDAYNSEESEDTSEDETFAVQYAAGFSFVNVYEVDRIYGGPEEGGWWFDAGQAIESHQVPDSEVDSKVAEMEAKYPRTGDSSSVVYSGGDFRVWVENSPARDYPEVTPHYE